MKIIGRWVPWVSLICFLISANSLILLFLTMPVIVYYKEPHKTLLFKDEFMSIVLILTMIAVSISVIAILVTNLLPGKNERNKLVSKSFPEKIAFRVWTSEFGAQHILLALLIPSILTVILPVLDLSKSKPAALLAIPSPIILIFCIIWGIWSYLKYLEIKKTLDASP